MIERVLIVDDEPLARERLAQLVRAQAPAATLREAGNGDDALELIRAWQPQLLLLDVQMPGRTGLDVAKTLGARLPPTIFATAYDEHAVAAFELAAIDYLLKPFDDARFLAAWQRALRRTATDQLLRQARLLGALGSADATVTTPAAAPPPPVRYLDRVVVKHEQRTIVVMLRDVQWFEADGNYVVVHAGRARYPIRDTLTSLETRLDPRRWARIHRGTIVDLLAMQELQPWFGGDQIMILRDGTRLKVSRNLRATLARRLAGEG